MCQKRVNKNEKNTKFIVYFFFAKLVKSEKPVEYRELVRINSSSPTS